MMHTHDMMKAVARYRGGAILIPGRSGRYWITLSDNQPLDVELGDPAMGGHAGLGLGLALARPDKKVMLFDSEGDIQMSLGILATVAEQAPPNLYHFLIDNGVYATTGGQPVPNADKMQYDVIARGCGYPRTYAFTELGDFERPRSWARRGRSSSPAKSCPRSRTSRSAGAAAGRPVPATRSSSICAPGWASPRQAKPDRTEISIGDAVMPAGNGGSCLPPLTAALADWVRRPIGLVRPIRWHGRRSRRSAAVSLGSLRPISTTKLQASRRSTADRRTRRCRRSRRGNE